MKRVLEAIWPFVLIVGLLAGAYYLGGNAREKKIYSQIAALKPDTVRSKPDTILIYQDRVIIKKVPATIVQRTDTSYTAHADTTIAGVKLDVEYLHPEGLFSFAVTPPPQMVIHDTVTVTKPPVIVIQKETDWVWVEVAAALGLVVGALIQ